MTVSQQTNSWAKPRHKKFFKESVLIIKKRPRNVVKKKLLKDWF